MRILITTAVAVLTVACVDAERPAAIPEQQIGLSRADLLDAPEPDRFSENAIEPGEGSLVAPAYEGAPPEVPHGIADYLPITFEENYCIECHRVDERIEGEPTPIPESHYTDLRSAPELVRTEVVGARYNCVTCHASRTDASPLVVNRFDS